MSGWLIDTLVWTAALIGLVLAIRRPVARHFGPGAAYALWLLPALRLLLPTLTLPASYRGQERVADTVAQAAPLTRSLSPQDGALLIGRAEPTAFPFDLTALALAAWLAGAVVFLVVRFSAYHSMRRELLAGAIPVGHVGTVRLVETSATGAPLAFGVIDKVVAMPEGFMAQPDRLRRDLALEHELQHHAGRDLLANFAVQPLFALHWFNPLGWMGWRAMRRDQEAACDARVLKRRGSDQRAAYAGVIAGFAAGPRIALAAPMACPVLGEKSIIQRLRSLHKSDLSKRRRMFGRAMVGAGLLALPLTASITYAEPPVAPAAPEAPLAPAAPAAPAAPLAPLAPLAPEAPLTPDAPPAPRTIIHMSRVQGEDGADRAAERAERHAERVERRIELGHGGERKVVVDGRVIEGAEAERYLAEMEADLEELRAELGEHGELAREIRASVHESLRSSPVVRHECSGDGQITSSTVEGGREVIRICKTAIMRQAGDSLRAARAQIAHELNLSEAERKRALRELDRELRRLESES